MLNIWNMEFTKILTLPARITTIHVIGKVVQLVAYKFRH